jgi:PhnB protein
MAKVHAYLNFNGNCEEAFNFYQQVFDKPSLGKNRYRDMPPSPDFELPESEKNKILHTAIMINDEVMLMGSDCSDHFGQKAVFGTSTYVMLDAQTADEAKKLHEKLSYKAQKLEMELGETFFAELFSSFIDQFGVAWMIHYEGKNRMNGGK